MTGPRAARPGHDGAGRPRVSAGRATRIRGVLRYFLRLGTSGFGGPIAVAGYMQRDLVQQRGWIGKQDFLDGVALGQTMPGPLAAQVVMWTGYLRRGALGAMATAAAFIIPSFVMVTAVAVLYVHYAGLRVVTALTGQEPIYLIIEAGLLMIMLDARPELRLPRRTPPDPRPGERPPPPVQGAVPLMLPGRWFIRHRHNPQVKAFVTGATASAGGALSGAVVVPDPPGRH